MRSLFILLGLCCAIFAQDTVQHVFTSPVFAWSNTGFFRGRNLKVNDLVSTEDVSNGLQRMKGSKLEAIMNSETNNPEVIVVFAEPELRTEQVTVLTHARASQPDGGALGNLKGLIESYSSSSVSIPYAYSEDGSIASSIVNNLLTQYPNADLIVARDSRESPSFVRAASSVLTLAQLMDNFKSGKALSPLSDGVTDVIYVSFASPAVSGADNLVLSSYKTDDSYMMNFHEALKASNVPFVAAFTAERATDNIQLNFPVSHPQIARFEMQFRQEDNGGSRFWPPEVIEGLILMIPFLIILIIGICCTCNIQSALKFEADRPRRQ